MITEPLGIYVHIPFCKSKCRYCDFVSFKNAQKEYEQRYVNALISEACEYSRSKKIKADTVFFGGGTPSVLSEDSFAKIALALKDVFDFSDNTEFTIEANPKTLTKEKLSVYRELGVNRISLGLQTSIEKELKILGRIHNFEDFLSSYKLCLDSGIKNINVDLMYAVPYQTVDSFFETLKRVIEINPKHISAYSLILEEGTPLFLEKEKLPFPTEDEECRMYYTAAEILSLSGYCHYEISNYAKPGYECRHNLKYWRDKEYVGLGLAAHSYFDKKRYSNPNLFSEYFSPDKKKYITVEEIGAQENAYEYAMLGLRLSEGISLSEYEKRFNKSFFEGREEAIECLISANYIKVSCGRIFLTEAGFYVSNAILRQLL